jgi:hypothetical protein
MEKFTRSAPWLGAALLLGLVALGAPAPALAQDDLPSCSEACLGGFTPLCSTPCRAANGERWTCGNVPGSFCQADDCTEGYFIDDPNQSHRLIGQRTKVVRKRVGGGAPRDVSVVVNIWAVTQAWVHTGADWSCQPPITCDRVYETDGCDGDLFNGRNWGGASCNGTEGSSQARCLPVLNF